MSLSIRQWLADRHIELTQLGHSSAQMSGIAFRIVQDMEVKSLNPFAISVLTDVLELPITAAWEIAPALSQLSVALLRILSRKKPLRRNEGTWLTFQIAYLNALQGILEQEARVGRPWVDRAGVPVSQDTNQPLSDPQLIALLKTLRPGRLSDSQAEQALSLVGDSLLVQQMNNLAIAWFVANGAEDTEARLLVQRLSHGLSGHLLAVVAQNPLPLAQLQKFVRLGNLSSLRESTISTHPDAPVEASTVSLPLNLHREYYRVQLLQSLSQPLLGEPFSLKDLYIPLKGKVVQDTEWRSRLLALPSAPTPSNTSPAVDLMEWAMSQLQDKTSIATIEAEPGGGKTSFCQMLAARLAQEHYPSWMPVAIDLRHASLGQTLEQTLDSALPIGRFTDTDGWLSLNSPPCLLILDGLDELPHSSYTQRYLWTFMDQVIRFHRQAMTARGLPRHKIMLTGSREMLDSFNRQYWRSGTLPLPNQIQRIVIEPMGQEEFRQWFSAWAKLQSKAIAQTYFSFLKHGGVFQHRRAVKDLAELLTRPLMLYLVGILHRDAWVDESIFHMSSSQVKFEIYDRITRWLLGEPATGIGSLPDLIREGLAHASRSPEAIANLLEGRHPQEVRHQMQVAALTLIQAGQNQAASATIESRLTAEPIRDRFTQPLPALFFRSQLNGRENTIRSHSLAPFPPDPRLEFSHLSLGEYLGAQEIATQLMALSQRVQNQYGEVTFAIHDPVNVAQHLYTLLGYGLLSTQIEELVVERLRREEKRNPHTFSFCVLIERLYPFYRAYCQSQWLDAGIAHQTHSQLKALHHPLTVLQIDAVVGLNVFLLLCSGAREAAIPFWPCGNPNRPQEFDPDRLLSLIARTATLCPSAFWQRVRQNLANIQLGQVCLHHVMLAEANLSQANLSGADLVGINLATANLQNANLSLANLGGANLANANLSGANLEGTDLSGANLAGANLKSAHLRNACLFQAQLDEPTKSFALKSGAIFSLEEFWAYQRALTPNITISHLAEDDLLDQEPTIFIESAEGEPLLPERSYTNEPEEDGYEGDTVWIDDSERENLVFYDEDDDVEEGKDTIRLPESFRKNINAQTDSL
jgi:hypothetical protein